MITVDKETRKIKFYKRHETDKVWQVKYVDYVGLKAVSFDKKKILLIATIAFFFSSKPCL